MCTYSRKRERNKIIIRWYWWQVYVFIYVPVTDRAYTLDSQHYSAHSQV